MEEVRELYKFLAKNKKEFWIPLLLFAGMMLVQWVGGELLFQSLGYEMEMVLKSVLFAYLIVFMLAVIYSFWPKSLFSPVRSRFENALRKLMAAMDELCAKNFYLFLLFVGLFISLAVAGYVSFVILVVVAVLFAVFPYVLRRVVLDVVNQERWVKKRITPGVTALVVMAFMLFLHFTETKTQRIVVSLETKMINDIFETKSNDTNYQEWIKSAIQEKLDRDMYAIVD